MNNNDNDFKDDLEDQEYDLVFCEQYDPNIVHSETTIADLDLHEKFIFRDKIFTKLRQDVYFFSQLNVLDEDRRECYLHPLTFITRLQ